MKHKPAIPRWCPVVGLVLLASFAGLLSAHTVRGAEPPAGKPIFLQRCAACHGDKGQGTKLYQKSLTGRKSVGELAQFIAKSMPPGAPKKLPAAEAKKVATYIYDAFYSPIAQARNRPARIALSRLTVGQYRNAVADLIGSFRTPVAWGTQRGLHAEYFRNSRFNTFNRVTERVDPEVNFDFGTKGALPAQDDPYQFSMRWEGSVLAPETGDYDFVVHTEHGMRLWVNDLNRPLIDHEVKSGKDIEYRASIYLLGGRVYPLRLEFSKGVTGVNNIARVKAKPPMPASMRLSWRRPKQAQEVIPQRDLLPVIGPEMFAVSAPFPPDDRSEGYERGTSVSKEWEDACTEASIETAGYVLTHLNQLSGATDGASDREAQLKKFCKQFTERAFRRPLGLMEEQAYVNLQFLRAPDLDTAVKRVVLAVLNSPRFLYRELGSATPDAYDVASRLSFGLWDSLPDTELLKAAAAGELATREQVTRQAERMIADPRAHSKLRGFFLQWLKVDPAPELAKDSKLYPAFNENVASDLRTSLELFLDQVVWSDHSDYRDLLLSNKVFLNGRLATLYGVNLPPDAPFQEVALDPTERAGLLTQPYLLATFAHADTSSPIHRGVLVVRSLLGRLLPPPPAAFVPLPADQFPNMSTRQRITMQTKSAACVGCHGMINPIGFTLEKFDAIGRIRAWDNGRAIDASGRYQAHAGPVAQFFGARGLARYLVASDEAHKAFTEKLFQYLVKQPVQAYGPGTLPELERAFAAHDYNMRHEAVEIMAASALTGSSGTPAFPAQPKAPNPGPPAQAARNPAAPPGHSPPVTLTSSH